MTKDAEHRLIIEKLDQMQKTFDRFLEDFKDDTRARGDMQVTTENTLSQAKMTREDVSDLPKEVKRVTEDSIDAAIKPLHNKVNKLILSKKKIVEYVEPKRKGIRGLINKIRRRKVGD